MTNRNGKLIALALCVCLLLSGCNLIRTDPAYTAQLEAEKAAAEQAAYEADMNTALATYLEPGAETRGTVTKAEVASEYTTQANISYMYMNYMYSMFYGTSYTPTAEEMNKIKNTAIETIAKREVLHAKMLALGIADFTQDELTDLRDKAKQDYANYAAYYQMMGAESSMVSSYLMLEGITEDTLYDDAYDSLIEERLSGVVNADTAVSEEEIEAKYKELVETARTKYTETPADLETEAQMGNAIYYMPEGFKYVKHVFIRPEDESVMNNVTTAKSDIATLESDIQSLADQITAIENATPSEATAGEATPSEADIPALEAEKAEKELELVAKRAEYDEFVKAAWASVQAEVDEVLAAIQNGDDFDALIEAHSDDMGSTVEPVKTNGYLVYKDSTTWDAVFLAAVNSLENVGDVSEPVLGSMGVHIVKYESSPAMGEYAFETVRESATSAALEAKKASILTEAESGWLEEAAIEYHYDAWTIQ